METLSSEDTIPVTSDNDKEYAISQVKRCPGEPQVAQPMRILTQAPSTENGNRLPLRRSPSPVADQRVLLWKNENRSFKGTIDRDRTRPDLRAAVARAAQKSALMVDGQPQFVFFCDGSSAYNSYPNSTQDGGYAVVFRDPYGADKATTFSAFDLTRVRISITGPREEDGLKVDDFTMRYWLSHRTFGAAHVEMAALAQALEEVIKRNNQHRPETSTVKIFTDSDTALARVSRGILNLETNTFGNSLKRKRENKAFFEEHTNPFVRLIVWQSHYLFDRGCTIKMIWMPRNTTLGHRLADHMAGKWKGIGPGDAFNQKYLPHDQRDGMLDKLHEEVSSVKGARRYNDLDFQHHQKKGRKIKRATGAKRRSTRDLVALLDSPSDYIPLDSDTEDKLEPQPQPKKKKKNKQKIKGAIRDQKRSTEDYILLNSDSERKAEPKPQSPKKEVVMDDAITAKQIPLDNPNDYIPLSVESEEEVEPTQAQSPKNSKNIKGATTAKQRSTNDFILLDSGSDEEPQRPKKRRRVRRPRVKKTSAKVDTAPDSPSDYTPLDSESEKKAEPQPGQPQPTMKKQETKDPITVKQKSTSDYVPLGSDSEQKPKPKPQPPKKKQEIKGTTTVKQRSTSDFILLDSDSEEQPEAKRPQTPKKRKKTRGAIPAKKKAPIQQVGEGSLFSGEDHEAAASGFLHGADHAFTFAPGNLPSFPTPSQRLATHDPESGHGTPGCLLCDCEDNDYPWRSGYTGLPSQWALRRY